MKIHRLNEWITSDRSRMASKLYIKMTFKEKMHQPHPHAFIHRFSSTLLPQLYSYSYCSSKVNRNTTIKGVKSFPLPRLLRFAGFKRISWGWRSTLLVCLVFRVRKAPKRGCFDGETVPYDRSPSSGAADCASCRRNEQINLKVPSFLL